MSPDIEWHVGEEAERETIARTAGARRLRRSRWAVFIAIGLGLSLGLLYRSIPEPPHPPVPTPTRPFPTATQAPPSLEEAIRRDVYALAANAPALYHTLFVTPDAATREYADWYRTLQSRNAYWNAIEPLNMYTIFETGTLPSGIVWVKMGQFRNDDFFRQTRFYRLRNDRWEWTLPDQSFWSGVVHTHTFGYPWAYPFTIKYPIEDEAFVQTVGERFAQAFTYLCSSLNCPPPQSAAPPGLQPITLTVVVDPAALSFHALRAPAALTITMPSLRVVGYYENPNRPGDPLNSLVYDTLIDPITQLASGDYQRWSRNRGGEVFLQAIANGQRAHIQEIIRPSDLFFQTSLRLTGFDLSTTAPRTFYAAALRDNPRVPLISLWNWSPDDTRFGLLQAAAQTEAESVVAFMRERYGQAGVIEFLNALGKATSLEEALEAGLHVKFGEFNRQWSKWIAQE